MFKSRYDRHLETNKHKQQVCIGSLMKMDQGLKTRQNDRDYSDGDYSMPMSTDADLYYEDYPNPFTDTLPKVI